jgi:hypothetical protein
MIRIMQAFVDGLKNGAPKSRGKDKKQRENMSEKQVDKMIKDSFPASDPPSTY